MISGIADMLKRTHIYIFCLYILNARCVLAERGHKPSRERMFQEIMEC